VALGSAGPYADLHLAPDITMPAPHHSVFLQTRCPSHRPTNSVKALKAFQSTEGIILTRVDTLSYFANVMFSVFGIYSFVLISAIGIVGVSACVIFILHQKIQKMANRDTIFRYPVDAPTCLCKQQVGKLS